MRTHACSHAHAILTTSSQDPDHVMLPRMHTHTRMKVPKRDATIRPPHLGDLDFEKNQLFDLRTDLPHS